VLKLGGQTWGTCNAYHRFFRGDTAAAQLAIPPNPLWTAAALAEAWCVSRLGLSNGNLNRYSAMSVSTAIEAFASEREA
jgi:hypothetical protein